MKRPLLLALFGLAYLAAGAPPRGAGQSGKAIICLTYDDGLPSHLGTVLPQLQAAGLKATFFLNGIAGASTALGEASPAVVGWTTAAANGHELANHTLFHACPEELGWQKAYAIESYTVERMVQEVKAQNNLLALLDPARKIRSFAYPCNNLLIGTVDYGALLMQQGLVRYGRAGGDRLSVVTDLARINPMQMPSWMVEQGTTLAELVAFAEKAKKAGGVGIYQFHGVGAEFFTVSTETHQAFLAYLKQHANDYRVLTFSEAMEAIARK
ncbi:MAG TPA: polysaccharide deacetylase family protein [Hymenobacter sp.]|jgi:peptidoglycan/xylan/chitin deacetylase (PgdA/CDA1 family)|uniref:polysaccharide deacetylase family protein n=1 Tax=Hymenobacter sp. TaxID=1898978 RepID=UPI002ED9B884